MQYGQVVGRTTHNFPKPFPHACLSIAGSPNFANNECNWNIKIINRFSFQTYNDEGGGYVTFTYIAIGY